MRGRCPRPFGGAGSVSRVRVRVGVGVGVRVGVGAGSGRGRGRELRGSRVGSPKGRVTLAISRLRSVPSARDGGAVRARLRSRSRSEGHIRTLAQRGRFLTFVGRIQPRTTPSMTRRRRSKHCCRRALERTRIFPWQMDDSPMLAKDTGAGESDSRTPVAEGRSTDDIATRVIRAPRSSRPAAPVTSRGRARRSGSPRPPARDLDGDLRERFGSGIALVADSRLEQPRGGP